MASGIAAILIAMMPLWFALLGWIYLRERLPRIVVVAIGIGFLGTALLVWPAGDGANRFDAGRDPDPVPRPARLGPRLDLLGAAARSCRPAR